MSTSLTLRGRVYQVTADGDGWGITTLEGLDLPEIRSFDGDNPTDHGVHRNGPDLLGPRTIVVELELLGDDDETGQLLEQASDLAAVWAPDPSGAEEELLIDVPGRQVAAVGRPRGARWQYAGDFNIVAQATFASATPRLYGVAERTAQVQLAGGTSDGATFDVQAPLIFGTGGSSGVTALPNVGNAAASPVIEIVGPVTWPSVEVIGVGTVQLAATVPDGTTAFVDVANRRVTLDGSPRYGWHRGGWPTIPPGGAAARMTAQSPTGSATFRWRDTYTA